MTAEDNAAVALRILGHSPDLVWLIPSGVDGPDGATGDTYDPWPAWTTPVTLVLVLGTALLALVRGRRLGRLVTEPLPVTVRAAETTEAAVTLSPPPTSARICARAAARACAGGWVWPAAPVGYPRHGQAAAAGASAAGRGVAHRHRAQRVSGPARFDPTSRTSNERCAT